MIDPENKIPIELEEGIKVIEIPAKGFGTRKIFQNLKPQHLNFTFGQKVLPASFVGLPDQGSLYFRKYHAPGEVGYKDGAYECYSEGGGIYNFYLDALMVHPSEMKKSERVEVSGMKKRGRKADPNKIRKIVNKGGKRGRKPLDPEIKAQREKDKQEKSLKSGGKRGRPPLDPTLKKSTKIYEKKGTKRGRKPLDPELKAIKDKLKEEKALISGGRRGRPSLPEHLKKPKKEKKYSKRGRPSNKL